MDIIGRWKELKTSKLLLGATPVVCILFVDEAKAQLACQWPSQQWRGLL